MSLFDSHTQIQFKEFDSDRDEMLTRAREAGVAWMVTIGTDAADSEKALEAALQYEGVYASAGIHPHEAEEATEDCYGKIETLLQHEKVVAVGEVGLDFFRNLSDPKIQEDVFEKFFPIYERAKKPIILHCRDAFDRLYEMLRAAKHEPYNGIMHCYTGSKAMMFKFLDMGFHISFAGPVTYKKNDEMRDTCAACPKDRLLVETDAPYLPPQTKRGKRNEPAFVKETAESVARARGVSFEEISKITTQNAKELFKIARSC